jgi:hypothetical protein
MAETLISPGVLAQENDQSFISQGPITVGAAIIGPTVKGPYEIPTIVTSYSDYQAKFGTTFNSGGQAYTYFTSIAAYNYFNNGGETLLVARVASGTFTAATSSVQNYTPSVAGNRATGSYTFTAAQTGSDQGFILNIGNNSYYMYGTDLPYSYFNNAFDYYFFSTGSNWVASASQAINSWSELTPYVSASFSGNTLILSGSAGDTSINGTTINLSSNFGVAGALAITLNGATTSSPSTALTLETLSEGTIMNNTGTETSGALVSGSANNVRWQIVNSNTGSGTFDLLVRRGDDNNLQPIVLETWTNLSLDPFAPNYVTAVIGDYVTNYNSVTNQIEVNGTYPNRSAYIRVKSVLTPTPNFFNNNGVPVSAYTSSIPTNNSGTFDTATGNLFYGGGANYYNAITTGASNIQGINASNYNNMINLLANQDDYRFNILLTPGLISSEANLGTSQITTAINNTQNRGDSIYVVDLVPYGTTAISTVTAAAAARNTSYAASYWPWTQTIDPDTGKNVWVPASTMVGGVYAYNDNVSEPWFAPAGINRGGLTNVIRAEWKLTQNDRDSLYTGRVNPIATFPGQGVVVYGQKTLQTKASALDRVNVRRLLIALKSYISQVAQNLVFEQNSIATRNQFLSQVNPYLASVQQRQGLYAFRVIMDDSNNTPDVIDRNQLVGQIYIQPTKTAEFIYLDFNILPTGATFPA